MTDAKVKKAEKTAKFLEQRLAKIRDAVASYLEAKHDLSAVNGADTPKPKRRKAKRKAAKKATAHKGRKSLLETNPQECKDIAAQAKAGDSVASIAKNHGLSVPTVYRVIHQLNGPKNGQEARA